MSDKHAHRSGEDRPRHIPPTPPLGGMAGASEHPNVKSFQEPHTRESTLRPSRRDRVTLSTPVCALLGCDYPIILAGMGGVSRSELVTAVTRAGGFGFLGMVREPAALIRQEVEAVRRCTTRPFGVNLIPAATEPALLEQELAACIELGVSAVALFWDLSREIVARLRQAGILVVCQVGSADEAREAVSAGAQILIAQGVEAGGHVRGTTPLHELLQQIIPMSPVPVLAAGGLVDGQDLVDVLHAGAQGAVLGTAFLASPESFAHYYHKKRVVDGHARDTLITETFHINWPMGAAVRVLRNSVTRGERGAPSTAEPTVIGSEMGRPIYLFSTDSPLRSMTGDFEAMALYAGCGIDRIRTLTPAGTRLAAIMAEAAHILFDERTEQIAQAGREKS